PEEVLILLTSHTNRREPFRILRDEAGQHGLHERLLRCEGVRERRHGLGLSTAGHNDAQGKDECEADRLAPTPRAVQPPWCALLYVLHFGPTPNTEARIGSGT